jgi:hypothetical protein
MGVEAIHYKGGVDAAVALSIYSSNRAHKLETLLMNQIIINISLPKKH